MPFMKLSALLLLILAVSACQPSPDKIHKKVHAENGTYAADISDDGSYSLVSTDETGLLLWPRYANNAKYQWEHEEGEVSQIIDVDIAAQLAQGVDEQVGVSVDPHPHARPGEAVNQPLWIPTLTPVPAKL